MRKKLKKYMVVDHNLKKLREFDTIKEARKYVKRNSPKDDIHSYGIYERTLKE